MIRLARHLFALTLLLSVPALASELMVTDAWVRQPPPNSHAAAYLTLANHGDRVRTLQSVESECCARVEIHRTVVEKGVARMEPVPAIEVPVHGSLTFAPRGLHLMLIEPTTLEPGERVTLRLLFGDGESLEVAAPVRKAAPTAPGGHGAHEGH